MHIPADFLDMFFDRIFPNHSISEDLETGKLICSCGNPNCPEKSWGKHPKYPGWQSWFFDGNLKHFNEANIGIRCGHGLVVIDVDVGILPNAGITYAVNTGRGKHYYYYTTDKTITNRTHISVGACTFDVRSEGGYVIGAGSKHASGITYEWDGVTTKIAEIPSWILELITRENPRALVADSDETIGLDEALMLLEGIDLDVVGQDYTTWLSCGMAAYRCGLTLEQWASWSRRQPNCKESDSSFASHWRSFSRSPENKITWKTLRYLYWQSQPMPDDPTNIIEFVTKKQDENSEKNSAKTIIEHEYFPRIMYEIVQYIDSKMKYKTTQAVLAGAISAFSAVVQDLYKSPTNANLGQYILIVAEQGISKSTMCSAVEDILMEVEPECLFEDPQSAQAIVRLLGEKRAGIVIYDEWVRDAVVAFQPNAHPVLMAKMDALKTVWASGATLAGKGVKKKEDSQKKVKDPRFSLLGAGVLSSFEQMAHTNAFKQEGISSRILLFMELERKKKTGFRYKKIEPPKELISKLKSIQNKVQKQTLNTDTNRQLDYNKDIVLSWENDESESYWHDELEQSVEDFCIMNKEKMPSYTGYLSRHAEKVIRLATLIAVAHGKNTVGMVDISLAEDIVKITNANMQPYLLHQTKMEALEARIVECFFILKKKLDREPSTSELMRKVGSQYFNRGTAELLSIASTLGIQPLPPYAARGMNKKKGETK